jgi:glycerophosphodiester phosphodiesterase
VLDDTVNYPLVFQINDPKNAKVLVKVYRETSEAPSHPVHIGTAVALLEELGNTLGPGRESLFRDRILPIGCETFDFIGTVTVNFPLAKPFPDPRNAPKPNNEDVWVSSKTTRLVGHRGETRCTLHSV